MPYIQICLSTYFGVICMSAYISYVSTLFTTVINALTSVFGDTVIGLCVLVAICFAVVRFVFGLLIGYKSR